jgi:phage tail sheath protein FI
MPSALTFPGVYVEEIPSGVRTIAGVPTSNAAFVGRTPKGPTDGPVITTSYDDFVRNFGGLDLSYPLTYSVRDFDLNGGTEAIIVRLFKSGASQLAELSFKSLDLVAASPGSWANTLRMRITKTDPAKLGDVATLLGVLPADLFNLSVRDTKSGVQEDYVNLTASKPSARHITGVLLNQSALVRTKTAAPVTPTDVHADIGEPAPKVKQENIWTDDTASQKATANVNDSDALTSAEFIGDGATTGLYQLAKTDIFNLLVLPPDTLDGDVPDSVWPKAAAFCVQHRAMLIVDSHHDWTLAQAQSPDSLGIAGNDARNAALYFPRVIEANPLHGDQPEHFAPSGAIAGVMARTDVTRGVWKAPAGVDASLTGVSGLTVSLTDAQNGLLNPLGVNCLRNFPIIGNIIWGARTLRGSNILGDEYKYVPVRRTALFIEESLFRGLKWVVFEPNDEPLWGQIRLNVGAFMQGLFRQGAFQGTSARDAYLVKCDKDTTTQADINLGIVNVIVGFAPLKPAEFVVLKIQQMAGQIQV